MRGEYLVPPCSFFMIVGSPPHVWRIRSQKLHLQTCYRITSTCVENTPTFVNVVIYIRDHLHMCGEYSSGRHATTLSSGSPPHVWRIPIVLACKSYGLRITSTCVENTHNRARGEHSVEDHLHMCGEYIFNISSNTRVLGSPPHVWRIL